MNGEPCRRHGCSGTLEDGYCNACGLAEAKPAASRASASAPITTGTGSSPISRASSGSKRKSHSFSRTSRKQLGAGLITLPDLPSTEPEKAVLLDAKVPEGKRFCASCDVALKREAGFCGKCGTRYSFVPTLCAGDVVAGQYEIRGPIAFGGLGWIYLGFDRLLSRYVVLKGLLNTHDESAAAAAVAERQFLAVVKHPNIVGIYNFVQNGGEGFIVMEYVGGKTLKQIRQERGPLPIAEAIAYIHRILPAFAYLHRSGLVYCDFKPDNVMLERDDVKLIDLGGVRRVDDAKGDIYGTTGYTAPEAAEGPTPASDLFTVGRTLAVLLTDIRGFGRDHQYTLPSAAEERKFAGQESLYRFLLKATAFKADDRFETAEEMAEQLLGVLREVVATETGTPRPAPSLYFGADLLVLEDAHELEPVEPEFRQLPFPSLDVDDPGAQAVTSAIALLKPKARIAALRTICSQVPKSREARLRLAALLSASDDFAEAEDMLKKLGEDDPWDWRVLWFQALAKLAQSHPADARKLFDQVYFDLPGEIAPKLALGFAAELSGDRDVASRMYDLVARTNPEFVSAVFGLARCHQKSGDRKAAVAALEIIPRSSALYSRARIQAARILIEREHAAPHTRDFAAASALAESLQLEGRNKYEVACQILSAALNQVQSAALNPVDSSGTQPKSPGKVFGIPMQEKPLRLGLEKSLRSMAQLTAGDERIRLVDEANHARPRTLV